MRISRSLPFVLLPLLLLTRIDGASARPFEVVATFPVDAAAEVTGLRVAVGTDGTMVYAWQSGGGIWSQSSSPR